MNGKNRNQIGWILALITLALLVAACSGPDLSDGSSNATADTSEVRATTPPSQVEPSNTSETTGAAAENTAAPQPDVDVTQPTSIDEPTSQPTAEPTLPVPVDLSGALLPNHRIISYYGHPNSATMGILGEYSKDEARDHMMEQKAAFEAADPSRPVIMAFELIAMVAQRHPGDEGLYVARTGDHIIQEYVEYAAENNMLVILDLQIGHDTVENQINSIAEWLKYPHVHVALDPEFSMKANIIVPRDRVPGDFIGELDGVDILAGMHQVARIVAENNLPPKLFIVHQFEDDMIFHREALHPVEGVQFVLDMDGFGDAALKLAYYDHYVTEQLIEFGGIKLFYKQDSPLLLPEQIVRLDPPALLVIYQ